MVRNAFIDIGSDVIICSRDLQLGKVFEILGEIADMWEGGGQDVC